MKNLKELLNGQPTKDIDFKEFEAIINTVGINWYGVNSWTGNDLVLFEEKFEGYTCELIENKMRLHNINYDFSHLYK